MENVMKLKARHFKGTVFSSNTDCAVARAAKEQFNTQEVNASTVYLCLNNSVVLHLEYTYAQFKEDSVLAGSKNHSDETIRTISLTNELR